MVRPLLVSGVLAALLACSPPTRAQSEDKVRVLIVTGANNHDWEFTAPELKEILAGCGRFEVDVTEDPARALAEAAKLRDYGAFVLDYNGPRWGEPAESAFLDAVRAGAGVAVIHAADNAFDGWGEYEKLVGLCWREGSGHGRFHAFDVTITDRDHPLTADMPDLVEHPDELYHRLQPMHGAPVRVLASARSSRESDGTGEFEPMIIVGRYGQGRVFHTPLGHVWKDDTRAAYEDPHFRWLIARGTEWAATGRVTLPPHPPNVLTAGEREAGFHVLFDGESTAGWRGYGNEAFPEKGWVVDGGALCCVAGGGGGDIVTTQQFSRFDLRFEWSVAPGANSGVIYLCAETEPASYLTGPEYQVLDDSAHAPQAKHAAAALYDLVAPGGNAELRPAGAWNTGRIVVREDRVEHWLNGTKVVDAPLRTEAWDRLVAQSKFADMPRFGCVTRGHIALQDHGNAVRFRSLRIRELE